jgi:hypothetical protein
VVIKKSSVEKSLSSFETPTCQDMSLGAEELNSVESWELAVEGSAVECSPAGNGSGRISIIKIRYQETSSEDIAEEQPLLKAVSK